jgi:hypothetical protein
MKNDVIYCYDILNNQEVEWAGADFTNGNMDVRIQNLFYTVPATFILFQAKKELNNLIPVTSDDVCKIGNTVLFYFNNKYYFVDIRQRYFGLIHKQESIHDYKTYLTFIKRALENKLLFKKEKKEATIIKHTQTTLYD